MVQQLDETALNIYTDGSCLPKPRRGGAGYLFITVDENGHEEVHTECPPGWKSATNNQMELQAAVEALELAVGRYSPFDLSRFTKIVVHSDSMYLVNNVNNAKYTWPKSKWRAREGSPVANTPQWKQLVALIKKSPLRVDFVWVKGHKDDHHNIKADELARASAETAAGTLKPQRVRRKRSPMKTKRGSVIMEGQETVIHITMDEWMRAPHNCYKYTYEVLDPTSAYHLARDICYSKTMLSAGHFYRVRFNEDTRNPWILEMLEEIPRDEMQLDPDEGTT